MYYIKVIPFGFIHKSWQDQEPRFSQSLEKAKSWKEMGGALNFGNDKITVNYRSNWELWQQEGENLQLIFGPTIKS